MHDRDHRRLSSPTPTPGSLVDLSVSERILAAEIAVIRRDERVRAAVSELTRASAATGRTLLVRAGTAGIGSLAVWILWRTLVRRKSPTPSAAAPIVQATPAAPGGTHSWLARLPWRFLMVRLWPLLPSTVRSRLGERKFAIALSMLPPLLAASTLVRRPRPQSSAQREAERFSGCWFELARTGGSGVTHNVMATYLPENDGLKIVERSLDDSRHERVSHAYAQFDRTGAADRRLEVTRAAPWLRWLPFVWRPFRIVYVERDTVLMGTPGFRKMWLLSRNARVDERRWQAVLNSVRAVGLDTSRLIRTVHAA